MKKFFITTLGCKVNQAESDAISSRLTFANFTDIGPKFTPDADVELCVINTCTVTGKASMQSRQAVRRAIRSFPNAKIIVTGCYAQTQPSDLTAIAGVDKVLGHAEKFSIPELFLDSFQKQAESSPFLNATDTIGRHGPVLGNKTRAVLKIQDGCNAGCTYCIVPRARGKSSSMSPIQVFENLNSLEKAGYREVVLSGIHLGSYGKDLIPQTSLTELLLRLEKTSGLDRIRLSSIEPREITDNIIQLISTSGRFCRHLHIPLQSGDDTILKKMARPYDGSFFKDLVKKIKKEIPDISIGSDVLVGFPGETAELFENTYSFVASLPFSYLHVFPYSPRQNTPADKFPDKVPVDVIKERCDRMRALGNKLKTDFYDTLLGHSMNVLIESGPLSGTGYFRGRSSNYVPVFYKNPKVSKNELVLTKIIERYGDKGVFGEPT